MHINYLFPLQLPAGAFHHIRTVSEGPSCFMYLFKNTTEVALSERVKDAEQQLKDGTRAFICLVLWHIEKILITHQWSLT